MHSRVSGQCLYTHVTLICNALVHVLYSGVSGQCSHTISILYKEHIVITCTYELLTHSMMCVSIRL